jgi:Mg-chelatase subunit ChlD
VAAATVALGTVASSQQATFRGRREEVRVDVLVSDRAGPVRNLSASDFEVRDNGVVQAIDFLSFDETPINVILALDVSTSVAGDRLEHLRRASHALVNALKPADRVGLISFSHSVDLSAALTTDHATVLAALDHTLPGGTTSLADACYAGLVMGETDTGRSILITFSDGVDTSSWLTPDAVLDTARRAGTVVYGAAIGASPQFLSNLSRATGGAVFPVDTNSSLDGVFVKILNEFRQRYLLGYSPAGVATSGWHRLDVRVKNRTFTIRARPGYLARKPGLS